LYITVLFKLEGNFALLQQTGKDQTVGIDKCNNNRTGNARRKQVRNSKHILTILTPVILPVY